MKKLVMDVPLELVKAAQLPDTQEKPYNLCYYCPAFRKKCDGPNCFAMLYPRWVEWINALAKKYHLTRQKIADKSNLPLATVNSALSGKSQDIRLSTAAAITKVVTDENEDACWGDYACFFAYLLMNSDYVEIDDVSNVQKELLHAESKLAEANKRITEVQEAEQRKVDFLKEQIAFKERTILDSRSMIIHKDRTIKTLGVIIGILGAALIGLLLADALIPDMGWFIY